MSQMRRKSSYESAVGVRARVNGVFFPRLNILTRDLLTNDSFEPHWEERWLLVLQNRTKER